MYKYQITEKLLRIISDINLQMASLQRNRYSSTVLQSYDFESRALSTFSSTSIEGNPLPLTEVRKLLKSSPKEKRTTEIEVVNYNEVLLWLNSNLKKTKLTFDKKLLLMIHKMIMQNLLIKSKCGRLRLEPVFVNDPKKKKTIYWPPDHHDLDKLLSDLFLFIQQNKNDMNPIILAGIFHKQFVIIHPFIDGNGRTVRLMTKSLLAILGFDTFHLFSFEKYYNQNISKYFESVGVIGNYYDIYKKIDFTSWLEYFAEGILDELYRVEKEFNLVQKTQIDHPIWSEDQQNIIKYLEVHGRINDLQYSKITKRAKATRALDFKKLCDGDVIERKGLGRATFYILKTK